ncbi:MAG: LicD family protein [Lachnospiraceae bacterium]|nr:LicD family protein [Lachnospiraceae bacterium]
MVFSEDYFTPEDRDGFHIREMMKRYWASYIEVLEEIKRVCKELDIRYYADYGTLLGAVREKGFIKWDDDVDLCMLRGDFEKFRTQAPAIFQNGVMLYNDLQTSLAPLRVVNTIAPSIDAAFLELYHGCPYPTGADIYVIDRVPDDETEAARFKELCRMVKYAAQRADHRFVSEAEHDHYYKNDAYEDPEQFEGLLTGIEEFFGCDLVRDATLGAQLTRLLNALQGKYWSNEELKNVTYLHGWMRDYRSVLPIDYYGEPVDLPFENTTIAAPARYKEVLTERFGEDYMTPVRWDENTEGHIYPAYKKSQKVLLDVYEKCGVKPPALYLE